LISNPTIAFQGLVRGRRYRHADLSGSPDEGEREARRFVEQFGKSREGRAYRPWVERFLGGQLPLEFGKDLRERWWRLEPLERKLGLRELEARTRDDPDEKASVRALSSFLKRLTREIGRTPDEEPGVVRINDVGHDALIALLEQAEVKEDVRDDVASEIFVSWPHRTLDQLIARVPGARALRRMKSRISFGIAIPEEDQFTLESLGPPPKEVRRGRGEVPSDVLSSVLIPPTLQQEAIRTFPSFETYMDDALHHPAWGYYARSVIIASGSEGHFNTHPEELSPRYGAWVARRAFSAYQEMLAAGELGASDRYFVIEFGAGNGRLARDFVDEVDDAASRDEAWRTFASRLEYRIYERSQSLREKQKALLGERATVGEGDARHPAATLKRDFPHGLRGFVVTNEVPDAFGVHKVLVSAEGEARAALVVPRAERSLIDALPPALRRRTAETNANLRKSFHLQEYEGDQYLDRETYAEAMQAIAAHADRETLLAGLWFEEAYVDASLIPELRAHLRDNAREYAIALAAEDSAVVLYPNLHADRFISELGSSLAAGLVLTIDYGDSAWGLIQGARRGHSLFRIYGEWKEYVPRPNDPYALPGTQDLTADVNFSALSRAGEQAGMTFVHYGPERDIVGKDLPSLIRTNVQEPAVAKFLGSPGFKCLVLGTRKSNAFSAELATPLSLASPEQEVPKSRRERIAKLVEILSAE
jgi:SAM-dependent MidA family methyltransferase